MYTTIAITTTSTLLDYSETMESPGDELDYLDAVNSAREDGFSVWEQKGGDTFFQTELRDEFGVIVRITLMTDLATCYPAGIGTLRDALDANEAEEPQVLETNEAEEPTAARTPGSQAKPEGIIQMQTELGIDARELLLWIENTEPLCRQQAAIVANLKRHIMRGNYSPARAVQAWQHLADAGSKSYDDAFGYRFAKSVRSELAAYLESVERSIILYTDEYNTDSAETARLRKAYRLSRHALRPRIRQLAEEERAADDAGKACENLRQMGCDTGFSTEYAAEWDRLDRIYTDARNQAAATELAIFEQSPAARADYQRFRALVVRHYNAS